jgi:hypothetical protein
MKKNLVLGFLILFVLSTTAFAGMSDPKKGSEKPINSDNKENRLSDEEVSRLSRRAETDNLTVVNNESSNSSKNLKESKQVLVEGRRHHGGYVLYGGGTLLLILIIILII